MDNEIIYPDNKHARMLELAEEIDRLAKSTFSPDEYENEFKRRLRTVKDFIELDLGKRDNARLMRYRGQEKERDRLAQPRLL